MGPTPSQIQCLPAHSQLVFHLLSRLDISPSSSPPLCARRPSSSPSLADAP
ncbi:hypothetical protein L7F22_048090, partial [Adiantum nelumboides]|nr:hypothetical protein [Adiantum nelumboides]